VQEERGELGEGEGEGDVDVDVDVESWCMMRRSKEWMCGEVLKFIVPDGGPDGGPDVFRRPCRAELPDSPAPASPEYVLSNQSGRHNPLTLFR
jgi:hypothetical protein